MEELQQVSQRAIKTVQLGADVFLAGSESKHRSRRHGRTSRKLWNRVRCEISTLTSYNPGNSPDGTLTLNSALSESGRSAAADCPPTSTVACQPARFDPVNR